MTVWFSEGSRSYILNLCILPTLSSNNSDHFRSSLQNIHSLNKAQFFRSFLSDIASEIPNSLSYNNVRDFDESWLKFKKYSVLNPHQVSKYLGLVWSLSLYLFTFTRVSLSSSLKEVILLIATTSSSLKMDNILTNMMNVSYNYFYISIWYILD